jgi:hypothetical protein
LANYTCDFENASGVKYGYKKMGTNIIWSPMHPYLMRNVEYRPNFRNFPDRTNGDKLRIKLELKKLR